MKKPRLTLSQKRTINGYLFILPWLVGFACFYVRSLFMTVQFSLSELTMDVVNGGYQLEFVGLENYLYAFTVHGTFKQILTTSVMDMLIAFISSSAVFFLIALTVFMKEFHG